jgi:hypothetical protein
MADKFKAEDMDGELFPHVRVNGKEGDIRGYIVINESPEETMEGAQRLALLFAASPQLLEACKFAKSVMIQNGIVELSEKMALQKLTDAINAATGDVS